MSAQGVNCQQSFTDLNLNASKHSENGPLQQAVTSYSADPVFEPHVIDSLTDLCFDLVCVPQVKVSAGAVINCVLSIRVTVWHCLCLPSRFLALLNAI